ncbi:DUF6473 family protein [Sulfitobacter aestuariivivens]|uniref:DUF6473 domain-containing protein n=1 Tax=Sulfitobacter aestuariivivens TaxID=2766981 RepID=A0A927HFK8_9RHOB|nr:DUF6473 family protein [Sulfitobacter aestuariivivens]MBD3665947.1 hypothetical protein [Sulfitobacter aestuariivivens]
MTYDVLGAGALDYLPCRYGTSRLLFRGPRRNLSKPFAAFIGGTETYGKFIEKPFPALIEEEIGLTCANFGTINAGVDVFLHDPFVVEATGDARVTVMQIMGTQNMSNRFYSVHPRRNDRFVKASVLLSTIYREVDFSEFHFNKHMLKTLLDISQDRFDVVRSELQQAWVARMRMMLSQFSGKVVLVWFANHAPARGRAASIALGDDPLFVTREMVDEIAPLATEYVEVTASKEAMEAGTDGMVFSQMETLAAQQMLGPKAHQEVATAVCKAMKSLM